ncbi:LOW QUALITY PROTEIN: lysosomal thioesterase PPT2 homolog [Homalodisca vitripennis]|uniref:LOW QUALITY PROTEIN: lysosomal thioesterase PPT2 homolog n=1 Tax=Homalodisca vitripennis TaxID=197043 RepID=UPI001EEC8F5C|nr:LOW QUALITY PROTEIN: lysosomal thioesterase PPT2 homolog [Homalodisca vitripennis]
MGFSATNTPGKISFHLKNAPYFSLLALLLFGLIFSNCVIYSLKQKHYKPVVLVHGILTNYTTITDLADRIREIHPGTEVYITNQYGGLYSLEPLWRQVKYIGDEIMQICAINPDGIHLIGYSQGGLIARGILEKFPYHNVKTFISLSSPQAGEYGTKFLHIFYPNQALREAYELFYSHMGQFISVGNYWNDPFHQELYYKYSQFLPYINNEVEGYRDEDYKRGITKLRRMVLIGGPDDGVIAPWQSSQFGFYADNDTDTVEDMRDRDIYKQDLFGLRTLDDEGKLTLYSVAGVTHSNWHRNLSVIDNYIMPWLS